MVTHIVQGVHLGNAELVNEGVEETVIVYPCTSIYLKKGRDNDSELKATEVGER